MRKLTFELEFITPAIIGGADPEHSAELRPASFVGLLRWWWRVVLATFVSNTEKIYQYESLLFGSQVRAGSVWLRLRYVSNIRKEKLSEMIYMIGQGAVGREYIRPGESFVLEILCPERYSKLLSALIELAVTFGGIGYRSRKGLGSLRIVDTNSANIGLLKADGWREMLKTIGIMEEKPNKSLPNLKNLKVLKHAYQVEPERWKDTLEYLGKIYKEIRLQGDRTYEYKSFVANFLRGNKIDLQNLVLNSLPLGLPIMYHSKSQYRQETKGGKTKKIRAQAQLTWKRNKEDKEQDRRRASSIIFNIKRDGFYILAFKCDFLPEGASLRLQAKGKYWNLNPSSKPKDFYIPWQLWSSRYEAMFQQVLEKLKRKNFVEVFP